MKANLKCVTIISILLILSGSMLYSYFNSRLEERKRIWEKYDRLMIGSTPDEVEATLRMQPEFSAYYREEFDREVLDEEGVNVEGRTWGKVYSEEQYEVLVCYDPSDRKVVSKTLFVYRKRSLFGRILLFVESLLASSF